MTVTRYESDGALDSTFGNLGRVVYGFPKTTDTGSSQYGYTAAYAVAVAPGGAIVVAGKWVNQDVAFPSDDACGDVTVARFTATGEPDTSFLRAHAGAVTDLGRCDWAQAVVVQPDGAIVAAGFVQPDAGDQGGFALVRYKDSTDGPTGGHDDASQTTSLTIEDAPPPPGALTVSVESADVGFGSLEAGAAAQANVGAITYENTLGNGRSWSAVVAATSLTDGSNVVPFTGMTFAPGAQITGEGTGVLSPGVAATFTGADTSPGSTYSDPVTTATAPGSAQGVFTQSGSTAAVQAPAEASPGSYAGTLQYTITG